ncbi:MAG: hypothetical protein M1830_010417 [Pleopsidium flavum]|nr:MAG: hypothetical protein M1830_010427 [Pleopsidium flavum]KAI9873904.1 MAG: hypothetical protein M1830_010417 [Pleopsidium flavum]
MPIPLLAEGLFRGWRSVPYAGTILRAAPWFILTYLLRLWFGGARNRSERMMHSKVVMITGGTSGIGAAVAYALAQRGAQIILLTHHAPSDAFLVDFVDDLRSSTNNELIYAEQVDLSSLHSIRLFATKWVDNAPPRRLDMIILCANTLKPRWGTTCVTQDGLEANWGINYLANFHLLSILSPAIRAQPPDRDVRVVFGTCSSHLGGSLNLKDAQDPLPAEKAYGSSKLALTVFAQAFQKHLDVYARPDKQANNARVIVVDPGFARTPGMQRWLTGGSLLGLLLYLNTWPLWWLILKSPEQGAQSFLRAAMEAALGRGDGGRLVKECREVEYLRKEVQSEEIAKKLWGFSEKQIEALEKESAVRRKLAKMEQEEPEKAKDAMRSANGVASVTSSTGGKVPRSRRNRKAG